MPLGRVRVGHICLEVSDIVKARRFYAPILHEIGFKIVLDEHGSVGWSNEDFLIFLGQPERRRVSKRTPSLDDLVVADHVALRLESRNLVDTVAEFMKKNGIDVLFAPEEHPEFVPGYYSVSYNDPDNNVLEFYSV